MKAVSALFLDTLTSFGSAGKYKTDHYLNVEGKSAETEIDDIGRVYANGYYSFLFGNCIQQWFDFTLNNIHQFLVTEISNIFKDLFV